jgi:hypothetical protein
MPALCVMMRESIVVPERWHPATRTGLAKSSNLFNSWQPLDRMREENFAQSVTKSSDNQNDSATLTLF